VLVAVLPLLLVTAGLVGFLVRARFGVVGPEVLEVVLRYFPAGTELGLQDTVQRLLLGLVAESTGFSVVGLVVLTWISARLVGSLRVVLRNLFDLEVERGLLHGKLFDLVVVLAAGGLITLNFGVTLAINAISALGSAVLGGEGFVVTAFQRVLAQGLTLASAWVLFVLLYRYVPARRIPLRVAVVGASFSALAFEFLKSAFAWYVTSVANYSNAYGSLAAGAVLFFWIYYSAAVFIVGGLVARTYEVLRETKMSDRESKRGRVRSHLSSGGTARSWLAVGLLTLAWGTPLEAQFLAPFGGNGTATGLLDAGDGVVYASRSLEREMVVDRPLVEHDGPYIVVHVAENRVFLMEGREVVWSAPAGTGHGFQLQGQGQEWTFTTPIGMFQVLRREKDPIWIAPDWYFVQRNRPIPAHDHPSRFIRGTLGTTALYLGDGIAIHGTDRPDLLLNPDPEARRVSHGCIRLTNEAARQLYHRVEVGTPVLIY
jgi:YihY family inner membrane protein